MKSFLAVLSFLALMATPLSAQESAEKVTFSRAVNLLTAEKERGIECARIFKRRVDPASPAFDRATLAYTDVRAEMNAAINELVVTLAEGHEPDPALQEQLDRGILARRSFCESAVALLPDEKELGEKSGFLSLVGTVADALGIGDLLNTWLKSELERRAEADKFERATIKAQLEAQRWPAFADIEAG